MHGIEISIPVYLCISLVVGFIGMIFLYLRTSNKLWISSKKLSAAYAEVDIKTDIILSLEGQLAHANTLVAVYKKKVDDGT